jgi:hypothetical protein
MTRGLVDVNVPEILPISPIAIPRPLCHSKIVWNARPRQGATSLVHMVRIKGAAELDEKRK